MSQPVSKYAHPQGLIRVYNWNQKPGLGTEPAGYVTHDEAIFIVKKGLAVPCVKGFAIHLKPDPERRFQKWIKIVIRDRSAQMGPRVIETAAGVIDGNRKLAKIAALSYLSIGSYCPLVPALGGA